MGHKSPSVSETGITIGQASLDDDDGVRVNVAAWEDVSGASSVLEEALPPLSVREIPSSPVSVRPLEAEDGFHDGGEIARGGMGAIRYVVDKRLLRQMALKTLPEGVTPRSDAAQRFVEEAQITGQLDHPNIVPVHELGATEDGGLYFTMKLVRGETLADVLRGVGDRRLDAASLEHLVKIIVKVCDAIAFAHARGVIHRDLKPSNVMIGSYNQVYVMDWGLALLREGPRLVSDTGKIIGTPGYMSPEQAWGAQDIDERADVYGIGGLLYRVLTGKRPHGGTTRLAALQQTREGRIVEPQAACPNVLLPPELCRITMRALMHEREARYQSVAALQGDLEQFLRGGGWLATRTYSDGAVIIKEGDHATEAYIVVSGECEAYKEVDGRRVSLRRMGAGEVFGETAILTGKPRSASVIALGDVSVKVVTAQSLEQELGPNSFLGAFVRVLAERFRELDDRLTKRG